MTSGVLSSSPCSGHSASRSRRGACSPELHQGLHHRGGRWSPSQPFWSLRWNLERNCQKVLGFPDAGDTPISSALSVHRFCSSTLQSRPPGLTAFSKPLHHTFAGSSLSICWEAQTELLRLLTDLNQLLLEVIHGLGVLVSVLSHALQHGFFIYMSSSSWSMWTSSGSSST